MKSIYINTETEEIIDTTTRYKSISSDERHLWMPVSGDTVLADIRKAFPNNTNEVLDRLLRII